mmetsp:Transcript_542/g.995  ORF Transcript_542/g.995 Transcript_542/m.995 type:complete len:111 (+) Transcript_542:67-399(+)
MPREPIMMIGCFTWHVIPYNMTENLFLSFYGIAGCTATVPIYDIYCALFLLFPPSFSRLQFFLLTSPALRIQDFFHNIEKTVVVSIIFYWIMSDSVRYHIPQETISFLLR